MNLDTDRVEADALPVTAPIDPVLGQRLADTLDRALDIESMFEASHRLPVHPASRLRRDEALGNAASGFNTASIGLVGALDHLRTWYQLIAGDLQRFPLPTFAPYSLARGAYEPALLTLWLLDPLATGAERIGRGYAAQLRSLDDLRKFQQDAGMTGAPANATALYERLFDAARKGGYVTVNPRGREQATVSVPNNVELFNQYDRPTMGPQTPAWIYRVLSGHAHGREWIMVRGAVPAAVDGLDTQLHAIVADLVLMCHLAERAVAIVERAVGVHLWHRTEPVPA